MHECAGSCEKYIICDTCQSINRCPQGNRCLWRYFPFKSKHTSQSAAPLTGSMTSISPFLILRDKTCSVKDEVCYCSDKEQTLLHIHSPISKALTISVALTNRQGTSSRGIFGLTLWQAALNSLRLCLPNALHIYQTNNPQLNWQLQFFLSGSILHSSDKSKDGPSNELKRKRCFSWGLFLRMREEKTERLTERWRLVIHVN